MARCDSYPTGQCTTFACRLSPFVGDYWGNADQWIGTASRLGFRITQMPTVGAVVVYGPGGLYSSVGHVAAVVRVYSATSFEVEEMDYIGWNKVDARNSSVAGVWGFILPPGVMPGGGGSGPPLAPTSYIATLPLTWGRLQHLWGQTIEDVYNLTGGAIARLTRIAQR